MEVGHGKTLWKQGRWWTRDGRWGISWWSCQVILFVPHVLGEWIARLLWGLPYNFFLILDNSSSRSPASQIYLRNLSQLHGCWCLLSSVFIDPRCASPRATHIMPRQQCPSASIPLTCSITKAGFNKETAACSSSVSRQEPHILWSCFDTPMAPVFAQTAFTAKLRNELQMSIPV